MKFTKLMKGVLRPINKKRKKTRFSWSLDENKYLALEMVKKLKKACLKAKNKALERGSQIPVRDWFMIELGLNTGFRVMEMARLRCGDIHVKDQQSSVRIVGKGRKMRSVKISPFFKSECLWFLKWKEKISQRIDSEACVLVSQKDEKLTRRALQKAFKRCMKKAGLPLHYGIHSLRHTYGSHLYVASNHNLRLVQEQLGHSSVRITEVYASLMDSDAKDALKRLYK